jgi:hypothetical protein
MMERDLRLPALRRFALAISVLTVAGHLLLGFEASWAAVAVALATAYGTDALFEVLNARTEGRRPHFTEGALPCMDFFLSSHISGLAISMLLFSNQQLWPIAFATAVAACSKVLLRVPVLMPASADGVARWGSRHFLNPSNTGIALTLLCFPAVGLAPPYQYTENLPGAWNWILPAVVVCVGSILNARFTHKMPLVAAWFGGFVGQALFRSLVLHLPVAVTLMPVTGMAFLLFNLYMISDPATTPQRPLPQVAFGLLVATVYGILQVCHVVFGLFVALVITSTLRGLYLYVLWLRRPDRPGPNDRPNHDHS